MPLPEGRGRGSRLKHAEMGRLPLISSGNRMAPKFTFYWASLGYITVRLQADAILLDPMLKDGVWINFTQEWDLILYQCGWRHGHGLRE